MNQVYSIVTEKILNQLEAGTVPWRRPWVNNGAVSWDRQRPYRGINVLLLDPGEYATYKKIQEAGGQVKKGAKGHLAVFWKLLDTSDPDNPGKIKRIPLLRYYKVFEVNTQATGIESRRTEQTFEHDPILAAETLRNDWSDCPPISFVSGRACYKPSSDTISIPPIKDYPNPAEYYSTLFHEIIHSTGHASRLARPGVVDLAGFGSDPYSREELVAEIGAAMLCGVAGIDNSDTLENSAAYINTWIRKLKEEPRLVVQAAAQAQKAADIVQGISFETAADDIAA